MNPSGRTDYAVTWTTAAQAMANMMHYTDKKQHDLVDVMGYTGLAFRLNIHAETVDIGGPYASFDWGATFSRGMRNLGFHCKSMGTVTAPPVAPTLEELEEGLAFVQRSIDRGLPVMTWDLFTPEFGVIYGYDDDARTLRCKDNWKDGDIPYTKLGNGQIGELFLLGIESSFEPDRRESLRDALEMVVDHARIPVIREDGQPFRNGLAGYGAWKEAFAARTVEAFANAYNVGVISDAREFAAEFLRRVSAEWMQEDGIGREMSGLAQDASAHYRHAADALVTMHGMFPFPQGGEPNEPGQADRAISLLSVAEEAEKQGVELLERMLAILQASSGQPVSAQPRPIQRTYP